MSATNIVFTNGGLDPWSGASPTKNLSSTLLSCFIGILLFNLESGAHHLDLRSPNAADPRDVTECRNFVLNTLKSWLKQYKSESEAEAES